jgi:hypothetical protein
MQRAFTDYHEAYAAAQQYAAQLGRDVGLEKLREYGRDTFLIFALPRADQRFGRDARCQVVPAA